MSRIDDLRSCPDAELLAAYLDGTLDPITRDEVSRHVAHCDECLFLLREAARDEREEIEQTADSGTRYWPIAAAIVFAVFGALFFLLPDRRDSARQLAATMRAAGFRPFEGRVSDFEHVPFRAQRSVDGGNPALTAAAEAIVQEANPGTAAEWHSLGVAWLALERYDQAVIALSRAIALDRKASRYYSDLAAARVGLAAAHDDAAILQAALADAERALKIDQSLPPALFNRALALERLGRHADAERAWAEYLAADPASEWAEEVRWRLARLRR